MLETVHTHTHTHTHTQGNLINVVRNDIHIVPWNNVYKTDQLII